MNTIVLIISTYISEAELEDEKGEDISYQVEDQIVARVLVIANDDNALESFTEVNLHERAECHILWVWQQWVFRVVLVLLANLKDQGRHDDTNHKLGHRDSKVKPVLVQWL